MKCMTNSAITELYILLENYEIELNVLLEGYNKKWL